MVGFVVRMAITMLGLWMAATLIDGISYQTTGTLVAAALLLGLVNAIVRPLALLVTLPLTLLSLGLFVFVINGAMLALVAKLLPGLVVDGFWSAVGGAIVVGLTGWLASSFIGPRGGYEVIVVERRG